MKTAVLVVSDLHINSTVALAPPVVNLDDGGTYHSSPGQRWLWHCWLEMIKDFKAQTEGCRRIAIFNGDLGELDIKRRSNQLISTNKATILETTRETVAPLTDQVDGTIIMRGTMPHVGKAAWLEEEIAHDLDNIIKQDGTATWYHLRAKFGGVTFDIAHHASMGALPWTEKNAANKIAAIILWRYCIDRHSTPPMVAIRSHNHRYSDSGGNYPVFAITTRGWTLMTEYGYRLGKENDLAQIGGHLFICEDKQYQYSQYIYHPRDERVIWKEL